MDPFALNYTITFVDGVLTVTPVSSPQQQAAQQAAVNSAIQVQNAAANANRNKQIANIDSSSGNQAQPGDIGGLPMSLVKLTGAIKQPETQQSTPADTDEDGLNVNQTD
jgi:hypothetical protein